MGSNPSTARFFDHILNPESGLTEAQKIEYLTQFFEQLGSGASFYYSWIDPTFSEAIPSAAVTMFAKDKAAFDELLPKVLENLGARGTELYFENYQESIRSDYFFGPDSDFIVNAEVGEITFAIRVQGYEPGTFNYAPAASESWWTSETAGLGNFS